MLVERLSRRLFSRSGTASPTFPESPFGTEPSADRETYLRLHAEARAGDSPAMEDIEAKTGFAIDRDWMDELALHTQITIKKSRLNYQHGRLLYATLRRYLQAQQPPHTVIFETGTARGFSSLCMAKALEDAGRSGDVVTLDILPHERPMIWNCIDDHDGPKTRKALLAPWSELLPRIAFLQGTSDELMPRLGLSRVHFAFLDAVHTKPEVETEFAFVAARQEPGDIVIFDDVTPALFPGVCAAIDDIEQAGAYAIDRITASEQRGYAVAVKR